MIRRYIQLMRRHKSRSFMLWHKILLVCLSLYMLSLGFSAVFFLNLSHQQAVDQETSRAFSDQALVNERIASGIETLGQSALRDPEALIARYAAFYASRQIELSLYNVQADTWHGTLSQPLPDDALLIFAGHEQKARISESDQPGDDTVHFMFVSSPLINYPDFVLIYARDISLLYTQRGQMIRTFVIIALGTALVIGFAAFFLAKRITAPLRRLSLAASGVADGQYRVLQAESHDETAELVASFNKMTAAIEMREKHLSDEADRRQHFIDNLTHEMNTPLTAIQGYAELLWQAHISQTQRDKAAETIVHEAKRLRQLQDKLTQLILARRKEPDIKRVDLAILFEQISQAMQPQLREKQMSLVQTVKLTTMQADPELLAIMLSNLIRNSIQASDIGASIEIRSDRDRHGQACLSVIDSGRGIPAAYIDKVFDPFFRVDPSRSRKTGGAGLGLALCQQIARLHYGRLTIESEENKGTTVHFTTLIQVDDKT